ncbi:molecular chaperone DnaJ [Sphingomonas sp. 1P06PA]|uniref:molecular chaperone DnaJ n=1 Tax=Sphingomonas sp. 1P06PA TaxID=554121 RepID=UPI0039A63739
MAFAIILAALVGLWAWKQGHLGALRTGDVAVGIAALAGLNALRHGQMALAIVALGGAACWIWMRMRAEPAVEPRLSDEEARALLELPPHADAEMVRQAHRRLIARVHPDTGGSEVLARRVNAARDTLLDGMNRRRD